MADIYIDGKIFRVNIPQHLINNEMARAKRKVRSWRNSKACRRSLKIEIIYR